MGASFEVEKTVADFPLTLVIDREATGGVPGLAPTVAVRNAVSTDSYLDWADNTFKTSGWTTKDGAMLDVGDGNYFRSVNVALLPLAVGDTFVAEYKLNHVTGKGADADFVLIADEKAQVATTRKYHTNRVQEASGNPGTLVIYDDNDVSILKTHQLKDEGGGAIVPSIGTPARRSKGV